MEELELEDEVAYTEFFRVNGQKFRFLVDSVGYAIEKKDTLIRESIRPDERIAVTLRYLATGETFKSVEYGIRSFRYKVVSLPVCDKCRLQTCRPADLQTCRVGGLKTCKPAYFRILPLLLIPLSVADPLARGI